MSLSRKEAALSAKRLWIVTLAYGAGVIAGALVTAAGFGVMFGVTGWDFVSFTAAGIFVLSLPLTMLSIAFRGTASSSASGAMLVGGVNGLISSAMFVMIAGFLAWFIMLPAGGIGGVVFWFVRRQLSRV